MEFRPLTSRWVRSDTNPILRLSTGGDGSILHLPHARLIESKRALGKAIIRILQPIEQSAHVCISETIVNDKREIQVELPRYGLHFFCNERGQLESRDLAAVVASSQSIGSLIGLRSRLVIEGLGVFSSSHTRSILIPRGTVSVEKGEEHVTVSIRPTANRQGQLSYFRWSVDNHVGIIRTGSRLGEILYLAQLNALTSYCDPDPLTDRTGTESAIELLAEAKNKLWKPLEVDEATRLREIALLAPVMAWYPTNLRRMQQVTWASVPSPLAQHDGLLTASAQIFGRSTSLQLFSHSNHSVPGPPQFDKHLLERSQVRSAAFYRHGFGSELQSRPHDASYKAESTVWNQKSAASCSLFRHAVETPISFDFEGELVSRFQALSIGGYGRSVVRGTLSELLAIDILNEWGALYESCRLTDWAKNRYKISVLLATIAYGQNSGQQDLLRTLLMISKSTGPWPICDPADVINFDLRKGWAIGSNELRRIIRGHWNYEKHSKNVRKKHPHLRDAEDRQRDVASQETTQLIDHIETQWPCDSLDAAEGLSSSYFNKSQAIAACIGKITTWNHNRLYIGHLTKLESMLAPLRGVTGEQNMLKPSIRSDARLSDLSWRALGIAKLIMQIRAQEDHIGPSPSSKAGVTGVSGASGNEQTDENFSDTTPSMAKTPETSRAAQAVSLDRILQPFSRSSDEIRRFYGQDLEDSLKAYRSCSGASIKGDVNHGSISECRIRTAFENLQQRDQQVSELKAELTRLWAAENEQYDLLRLGGLEPRGAPSATLATLAQKNIPSEGTWKDHSYRLGRSIQAAQQARRLLINLERNDLSSYRDELNVIRRNVDDMYTKYPEWLLLEIQNDFLIRPLQVRVAEWMLQLPPEDNALVQLNMGEGKSSVILPMVVLVSPHYKRAAHIIVLKPLHAQMLATLGRTLTGMVSRELLSTPLDRKTNLNAYSADLARLWRECAENKGVLVMLPENQLSFHIRCIQQPSLLKLKEGLDRDFAVFVDESDAILAENALLVYTEGTQRSLDGSPNRWTTTQTLLKILIQQLSSKYPDVRDITGDGTLYQLGLKLRALPTNALPDLIDQIPSLIMKDGVDDSLSIPYADPALRAAAARFIRHDDLDPEGIESLQVLTEETCWTNLLILRGLIAHGILLKQLMDKRWNVDFGLDRSRTLLAVPYRAKGVPSMSSEYQHPDVTVILTCLAWYHTGLSEIEMIECFKELMKSGDPSEKYKEWTDLRADMPEGLRNLENVNTEDKRQLQDWLVPVFAFNKAAIDFFLSFAVFPKKAKEFPHKLSASAWDISGAGVPHSMTGFSGTNDSRQLLPTSIRQHDLEGLRHTNAMMLERLLLPENQRYYIAIENGVRLDTVELLKKIISSGPVTRVIIDVGAQVMDLDNRSLASKWLELDGSADAVAFFDADDTLLVLSRDSRVEHFAASAQSSRPDNCNFYLDEVHTRGIDIKFIDGTHAAVTLGPRLTKDRLVQACMRLRKLGRTHSVSFYAPPEIDARIRACGGKLASDDITSADVCGWVMEETCQALHRKRPVWIEQGMRHRRGKLELDNLLASVNGELEALTDDTEEVKSYKQAMLEEDAKTLEEMYGPRARSEDHPPVPLSASMRQDPAVATLVLQWKALSKNDRMAQNTTQEQDRELEQELEQERQIQRPASMKPRAHSVEQLARLIDTGSLPQQIGPGSGMLYAFDLLRKTSVRALLPAQPISTELLCTRDFSLTVECGRDDDLDEYLRPVHFVLSHSTAQRTVLLIVSPFEVGALLENILRSAHVTLHVFSARATRAMPSLLGLSLYTLGKPWSAAAAAPSASFEVLRRELALFSGELYFPSLEHYEALCRFLGVVDGIHVGGAEGEVFERSPFRMLKGWVAMRRQGGEFERTHVGWLVAARRLLPDAFD